MRLMIAGWHNAALCAEIGLTALLGIPAGNSTFTYGSAPNFVFQKGEASLADKIGFLRRRAVRPTAVPGKPGFLVAWDPVIQKPRWRLDYAAQFNGGTVTTAGNLVFHSTANGKLIAYSADKGEKRWEMELGVRNMASPVTYEVDGNQYVRFWGDARPIRQPG